MYIVKIHNSGVSIPIHDTKEKLTSGKITKGINTIDSFQFTMLPSNAGWNEIHDYTTLVTVYNTNKGRYDFYGRVLYSEDTMDESGAIQKDVICESYFGFLCDSRQEYVKEKNWTVRGLLEHIVNAHNSQIESYKRFTIGEVTVTDPNNNIYIGIQRENTWEAINSKLIEKLGGEIRFRVAGDVIYLDYLEEIGGKSSTEITLSRNMKSIARERDPSEIVTRLIPLGCKLTGVDASGEDVETEYRLDITSVNGGKNYIEDETAIALYGIRVATVEFDDVTVASTLKTKGEKWLAENNRIRISYTATALDLSLIGLDLDDFDVCNYHAVRNPLLNINDNVRIIKKSIDICEEVKSTIEFGDNIRKLSETIKNQSAALQQIAKDYATNTYVLGVYEKTQSIIKQTEDQIRLDVSAEMLQYITQDVLDQTLADYAQITALHAVVDEYLNSEEGEAAIKMAVEGTVVTDDDLTDALGNYLKKTELDAGIDAYVNTETGKAEIISAVSGSFLTNDALTGYAKQLWVTSEINTSVSELESEISLDASYGSGTIGSNVRALLTLVSNPDSSQITLKADAIDLEGYVSFTDLENEASKTFINGANIISGTITADAFNVTDVYYKSKVSGEYVLAITSDEYSTSLIIGDNDSTNSVAGVRIKSSTTTFGTDDDSYSLQVNSRSGEITASGWDLGMRAIPFANVYTNNINLVQSSSQRATLYTDGDFLYVKYTNGSSTLTCKIMDEAV